MTLKILGLSGMLAHEASAAILADGKVIAAAEEERFNREKHARNHLPIKSARYCMKAAGLRGTDIDLVAIPFAEVPLSSPARWRYARRHLYAPEVAVDAILNGNRHYRKHLALLKPLFMQLGIPFEKSRVVPVEHMLAHASSGYHMSGFKGKTAILVVDGVGEYASTFIGWAEDGKIHKIKEFFSPDSLGWLFASMTEYLGLDAQHKLVGSANYGDPERYDLSWLAKFDGKELRVNNRVVNTIGLRRVKEGRKGYHFSDTLIRKLGPRRKGSITDDPWVHYAAGVQNLLEKLTIQIIEAYLLPILKETGQLVLAGACGHNANLCQRLLQHPHIQKMYVPPAAGDAGTSLGAAAFVSWKKGVPVAPERSPFLGPGFTTGECIEACQTHRERPHFERLDNPESVAAKLIAEGYPIAWCQGRMEFGPRALGARSIIGRVDQEGIGDMINDQIKYREHWRSFSPSILAEDLKEITGSDKASCYMNVTCSITPEWQQKMPEVINRRGDARVHVVDEGANPRYYRLLQTLKQNTGIGAVLNTSMNRRGEPMVCSPNDALNMFFGSNLQYLILEDLLVTKREAR